MSNNMKARSYTVVAAVAFALVALIVPIVALDAQSAQSAPPTSPVTGNAANGKTLYAAYTCYGCHGYNGETGRAFVGRWSSNLSSEESFIRFLRGRANVAPATPSTSMPNFAETTMSDAQARDIYAYIRTFKSNAPELKDIPTLNAIVKAAARPYKQ